MSQLYARLQPVDEDDLAPQRSMTVETFMHGECVTMAIALHRELGESLVVAKVGSRLVHAGTRVSDATYRDVRGVVDAKAFVEPFSGNATIVDVDEKTLRRLAIVGGGRPVTDRMVEQAIRQAYMVHPTLPGAETYAESVDAFGAELEDLCRRHGFFLRESHPNGMMLYRAYGDEVGYGFRQVSPDTFVATRLLGSCR